ncbi:MAG: aminopeptidase P family protein [Deltaproteobacteria bacterium]|jgi:Xaa-Pro aminopeptidase|nr:aminopeptidase P family protein [Deltaproteobacteria bacterium]MBW2531738.1 aminopeptidase P family protein [Deltaproteobacteria bacterium]
MKTAQTPSDLDPLILEKAKQVPAILKEMEIDLWLLFVRETEVLHDPTLDMVVGTDVTWESAMLYSVDGRRIALVGNLDVARTERAGVFDQVIGYVKGIGDDLRRLLGELDPQRVALNYSVESELADGLTHGMYLRLGELLEGTPYMARACSSRPIVAALRGRKSAVEIDRVRRACVITQEIFDAVTPKLRVGQTEKQVAALLRAEMDRRGLGPAWAADHCPAVFTGPDSAGAHAGPTDAPIEPGHVMNVDMGVKVEGYCSDMQRTWYFLREGEEQAPPAVQKGFETIRDAIREAGEALRPGRLGHEVDAVARGHITERGYPEYDHGLGHQVGRTAHDGTGLLCPLWERYGGRAEEAVEESQIYTLEPRLPIEGHGIATMEEIVVVTAEGCEYLSPPQTELYLVPSDR